MNKDTFFHKDFRFKMAADYYKMVGIVVYSFQSNKINGSSYTSIKLEQTSITYCSRKILKFIFAIKTVLARFFMLQVFFYESGKITRILWSIKYIVYSTIY